MAYRVDEASLTAVADAIREKSGTSEGLTFPEGFVQAVAGIQAGGSGKKVFITEIIPETDIKDSNGVLLEHGLGEIPDYVVVFRKNKTSEAPTMTTNAIFASGMIFIGEEKGGYGTRYNCFICRKTTGSIEANDGIIGGIYGNQMQNCYAPVKTITETSIEVVGCANASIPFLQSGVTYTVIAGLYS